MTDRRSIVLPTAVERVEQLQRIELRRLFERWLAAKQARGGRLPARADLSPEDLRPCMGNLVLLDVVDGGAAFRYRLYGTNVAHGHGADMTGQHVTDLPGAVVQPLTTLYRRVLRERTPLFSRLESAETVLAEYWDRLILPLAADGETVDIILSAMYAVCYRRMPAPAL